MLQLVASLAILVPAGWVTVTWGATTPTPKHLRYRGRHYAARIYANGAVPRFTRRILEQTALPAARLTLRQQLFLVRVPITG